MTDDEILSTMKKADDLLGEYEKMLEPVLAELARRFSMDMFGVPDKAKAQLSYWEAGLDTITLHPDDAAAEVEWKKDIRQWEDRKSEWSLRFSQKMTKMGIGRIGVTIL